MTQLPPWLEETRLQKNKIFWDDMGFRSTNGLDLKDAFDEGADWMFATLKPEIDSLVEALEDISGCYDQNSMDHANEAIARIKEKFPNGR